MASTRSTRADRLDVKVLLDVLLSVKKGDFTARLPADHLGLAGKAADVLNDIISLNQTTAEELKRLASAVGKEGRTTERAAVVGSSGAWAETVEAANSLVTDLLRPRTEMARVVAAVAKGDLSQTMALEIDGRPLTGEYLSTARTVNTMVEQLNAFSSEVTRVA